MNEKLFNGSKFILYDVNNIYSSSLYYTESYIHITSPISMSNTLLSPNLNAEYLNGTKSTQLIHNSMSGIQGSESAVQFYHLTLNQYNQLRTYFISTGSPDPNSGSNGDIWITYQG